MRSEMLFPSVTERIVRQQSARTPGRQAKFATNGIPFCKNPYECLLNVGPVDGCLPGDYEME